MWQALTQQHLVAMVAMVDPEGIRWGVEKMASVPEPLWGSRLSQTMAQTMGNSC